MLRKLSANSVQAGTGGGKEYQSESVPYGRRYRAERVSSEGILVGLKCVCWRHLQVGMDNERTEKPSLRRCRSAAKPARSDRKGPHGGSPEVLSPLLNWTDEVIGGTGPGASTAPRPVFGTRVQLTIGSRTGRGLRQSRFGQWVYQELARLFATNRISCVSVLATSS